MAHKPKCLLSLVVGSVLLILMIKDRKRSKDNSQKNLFAPALILISPSKSANPICAKLLRQLLLI